MKTTALSFMLCALTGCAMIQPGSLNPQKAAISTCASAGAYGQAIAISTPSLKPETLAKLKVLKPYCHTKTPGGALTLAEQNAFAWLYSHAEPYLIAKGETNASK